MDRGFWKNKRVLVTGFEGFLGSNLTRYLLSSGAVVAGLDKRVGRSDTILDKADYRKLTVLKGSVGNRQFVKKCVDRYRIDVIFHLAAEAIVKECLAEPVRAFSSNIQGTWNVLEACRHVPSVKVVIVASSDKAYGNHVDLPYREGAALCGKHPYDVSKSCADLIAYTYHNTYAIPVAVTRCGNIYGPGDYNFTRIVPDAFRCALSGKKLIIRSDGTFTRDYVYVDDIVKGYVLLAEKFTDLNLGGEAFNFSYEKPLSVIEIVEKIYRLTGNVPTYQIRNEAGCEIRHQYLSAGKARSVLGWKPAHGLDEGLKRTLAWYKKVVA